MVNLPVLAQAGSIFTLLVAQSDGTQVGVATFDPTGTLADRGFHLAAMCE